MKKILSLALLAALLISLGGCGIQHKSPAAAAFEAQVAALGSITLEQEDAILAAEEGYAALTDAEKLSAAESRIALDKAREALNALPVTKGKYVTLDGIAVDDSYRHRNSEDLTDPVLKDLIDPTDRMVFLFLTLQASDRALEYNSEHTCIFFDNGDAQGAGSSYRDEAKYAGSYAYGLGTKILKVGETQKLLITIPVPEEDLKPGRQVHFVNTMFPGMSRLRVFTDDIAHFDSPQALAEAMDPEGFQSVSSARDPADDAQDRLVRSLLNGRHMDFKAHNMDYRISFQAPDQFSLSVLGLTNQGSYTVRQDYIFCTYPSNGYTVEIPYEIVDGKIRLHCESVF